MTTASEPFRRRDERLPFRLAMWWGHYFSGWTGVILYAVSTFAIVVRWYAGDLAVIAGLRHVMTAALISGLLSEALVHDKNLCLRHVQESPLLDPQGAVDKNRRWLRLYHRRHLMWVMIALMLPTLTGMYVVPRVPEGSTLKVALTAVAVLGIAAAVTMMAVVKIHQRLHTWCPWCRRDDGGDDVVAPTPDPVSTATR